MQLQHIHIHLPGLDTMEEYAFAIYSQHVRVCVCVIDTMQMSQLRVISSPFLANSIRAHSFQCSRAGDVFTTKSPKLF